MNVFDDIASYNGRCAKIIGPARSGKTEGLVRRCAQLLKDGVCGSSILVETTTQFGAQAFRNRLEHFLGDDAALAANVRICTALHACAETLNTDEARAATGRVPRILNNAEYNFLLEDLKTSGLARRKLRTMLAFFYKQWSALQPKTEWIVSGKEEGIYDQMQAHLTSRDAMLFQEAPMICANYLKSDEGADARGAYEYLLADDYQNLSHAEQTCLCLLAGSQIIVAGNVNESCEGPSGQADPQGFERFERIRRNVDVFTLTEAFSEPDIQAFADALCTEDGMQESMRAESVSTPRAATPFACADFTDKEPPAQVVKWNSPEAEINGMTKYLRSLVDDAENLTESRIAIVVGHKRWARMISDVLEQRGFEVSTAGCDTGLHGDPRDSVHAKALVAYTKLSLLADPHDMTAWRSWCGFDNFLTNSDIWEHLLAYATEKGLSLYDALAKVSNANDYGNILRGEELAQKWHEGQEFIQKNIKRKGFALLRAIGAEHLSEFGDIADSIDGDEDAVQLFKIVQNRFSDPYFPESPHLIHVVTPDKLVGTEYDVILMMGMVNGFLPHPGAFEVVSTDEERTKTLAADRRVFHSAICKATKRLVVSYFIKSDLELAERTKMKVMRVKSENGARVASIHPSEFIGEAGAAAPATLGGQSLLAQRGLN